VVILDTEKIESAFEDLLNSTYPTYKIAGVELLPSQILKMTDAVAYRCALADFESLVESE
jgi:hypothetical protein